MILLRFKYSNNDGEEYLSVGPPWNAILSAYLLQYSSTYSKLLSYIIDGEMKVLGQSIQSYCLSQGHLLLSGSLLLGID